MVKIVFYAYAVRDPYEHFDVGSGMAEVSADGHGLSIPLDLPGLGQFTEQFDENEAGKCVFLRGCCYFAFSFGSVDVARKAVTQRLYECVENKKAELHACEMALSMLEINARPE